MIKKVLVANRGEIAIRVFHTLREMTIKTVAVYMDPDSRALHVQLADEAHHIGNYLDIDELVRVAQHVDAQAIHPGYGFLSENPGLPSACEKSGLIFIGPSSEVMRRMGDKLESKKTMEKAGIPVIPSWDKTPPDSEFPVIVKAVGGGGGKGMRLVRQPSELEEALASASREAEKAFGDGRVFIEKYIENPRHVEFQILGDAHGNVIHLFERECSIQRRHQKIIEETPCPALTPKLRSQMAEAAVTAAQAAEYRGAGTIEFILAPSGRFYFLEMNTRLQVEHPITEMTTGIDLVREQVIIADGQCLTLEQHRLTQTGHAIDCRIYAEVPEEQFRPSAGTIEVYRPPSGPGIRLDSGIEEGSVVSVHYDPLLAKLVAWAPTRGAATERMKRALGEFVLLGVRNNIDFLARVLATEDFVRGNTDTHFLERHPEIFAHRKDGNVPPEVLLAASLAALQPAAMRADKDEGRGPLLDVWQAAGTWRNT